MLIYKKTSSSKKNYKYFIYIDDYKVKPVSIPKTSTYIRYYDSRTKWMYFLNEDEELLKDYNDI